MNSVVDLLDFSWGSRLPLTLQSEAAECGLACLSMVLGYHGHHSDLATLRSRFLISSHGLSMKDLVTMASTLHLLPRVFRAEPEELSEISLPCILHWNMNHFVVLKNITRQGFVIHDPAMGERKITHQEFDKHFTGLVLELAPTQEFRKKREEKKLHLSDFWSSIVGLKRSLLQVIFLSILLQAFALVAPLYMQTVVDDVLLRKDNSLLIVLALGFSLLLIITVFTNALRQFVVLFLTTRMSMQMSANLFTHLIRLPMKYFSTRHLGDVVSRFQSLENVRELLTNGMVTAVVDGLMSILILIAMFIYDVQLALIVIGTVLVYIFFRWAVYRPFHRLNEEAIISAANESTHFMESVRAIQTIKIFQKEDDRRHQWQNKLAELMNREIKVSRWGIGYGSFKEILFGLENIVVIYIGAMAVMSGQLSLGMLYAFMSYKGRFIASVDSLINQWLELKMLDMHLNRLADIVHTEPETTVDLMPDSSGSSNHAGHLKKSDITNPIAGKIEVKNLAYRFSEQESYVFENVSFIIEPGESVVITGPSGCGKSTLLKCLMGLIKPTSGQVFIDDKPMANYPNYRGAIAGVMQDDQLMAGDIADNIACFDQNVDMERVIACANLAQIDQEIKDFVMGYNTLIGDMGANLSGGQKQRLAIARALYRDPKILFMDEASSHLDLENEERINQNIRSLKMTRVAVAHRPNTVASADREIRL